MYMSIYIYVYLYVYIHVLNDIMHLHMPSLGTSVP